MTSPVIHGTFTIDRTYDATPARVFAAWADIETKARWFVGPESWKLIQREMDFRVGGSELLLGRFGDSGETKFVCRYHVVDPERRIVFVYDMHHGGTFLSTSLATVEFEPAGSGTHLRFTEQIAFLDGQDGTASRKQGTAAHLEKLAQVLASR